MDAQGSRLFNIGEIKMLKKITAGTDRTISVDTVSGSSATYDGSFSPSGAFTLFKSLILGASIKNLKIYKVDKGEAWLTQ